MEMIKANIAHHNTDTAIATYNSQITAAIELAVKNDIMPAIDRACKNSLYVTEVFFREYSMLDTYKDRIIAILQDLGYTVTIKTLPAFSEDYYEIRW